MAAAGSSKVVVEEPPAVAKVAFPGQMPAEIIANETKAAVRMQALERGRQVRSMKDLGPPYTPQQRRQLEDALSAAVTAAMGLDASEGRLGYIARHLAAQESGRPPMEAPRREGKLTPEQAEELKELIGSVNRAVNACNCKVGSPLRNVANHLLGLHRVWKVPKTAESRARVARKNMMRAAAPIVRDLSFRDPSKPTVAEAAAHDARIAAEEEKDPLVIEAKKAAKLAFNKYDQNGNGTIEKFELFEVLLGLNRIPGTPTEQQAYLEAQFKSADKDGSGELDMDEFVAFYVDVMQNEEAERMARLAFEKYDHDHSNSLKKHELFNVLLELDAVIGETKKEKEAFLHQEFSAADADKGGSLDFAEFVELYIGLKKRNRSAAMLHQRTVAASRREKRKLASDAFLGTTKLFAMLKAKDVALLSASWLLTQAGYDLAFVDRQGRKTPKWTKHGKRDVVPLGCRQELERRSPEAFLSYERLEEQYAQFRARVASAKHAERDGVDAAPVIVISHCWEELARADPHGTTLTLLAAELARQMAAYASWGYEDVGVFFDWACVHQDTVDVVRSAGEDGTFERAIEAMPLLYANKQTTVFLIFGQKVEPPRSARGWPFYEECLTRLFKEAPPPRRYRMADGGQAHLWPKVVRIGGDDELELYNRAQGPPIAPTRFLTSLSGRVFSRPADRETVLADYKKTLMHGFSGLERLNLSRRSWADSDMDEFAHTVREINMPHVKALDLGQNDLTVAGLLRLGEAVGDGALHALTSLDLSDCSGLSSLPDSLAGLSELNTLKLDGCLGLSTIPPAYGRLGALKSLHIVHCLRLANNKDALANLAPGVQIVTQKK